MAERIGISIAEFESLTSKLRGLKEQVDGEMNSIGKTAEEMQAKWQGKASSDFYGAITEWQTKNLSSFNEIMENYLKKLSAYQEQMVKLDNNSF